MVTSHAKAKLKKGLKSGLGQGLPIQHVAVLFQHPADIRRRKLGERMGEIILFSRLRAELLALVRLQAFNTSHPQQRHVCQKIHSDSEKKSNLISQKTKTKKKGRVRCSCCTSPVML